MRGNDVLLMVIAACIPLGGDAQGVADLCKALRGIDCYRAGVQYSVTLPQAVDDVNYTLELQSSANDGDRLSPADYLIDWSVVTADGVSQGFSAYFDGHHYRYRDNRLQEYHWDWDSVPFNPAASAGMRRSAKGVQRQAQFAELLPQFIADEIERAEADADSRVVCHADTVVDGRHCTAVDVVEEIGGYVSRQAEYLFDGQSGRPLRMEMNYNPGALTEQTVVARYAYAATSEPCADLSEDALIARYPEPFGRFRQSNFRAENLPGTPMPAFSLPTLTGERYSRMASEGFRAPAVVALIDPESGFAAETVAQLRSAVDRLPVDAVLILAFAGNNRDRMDELVGRQRQGEDVLTGAQTLARDCGASTLPVVIVCRRDGIVGKVVVGFNNELCSDVIQAVTLAAE